jgi:maltose/moltooligosaccharide transporter
VGISDQTKAQPPGDGAPATTTTTTPTPAAQVLDYQSPDAAAYKTWRAGMLLYTTPALIILFCWLLWGDFAWSMKERAAAPVVTVLLKKFQASDTLLASLMVSLPAAINILLGPVISFRSDRHRGRWGRRIPYLIATTPIAAAAMIGLAFSPKLGGFTHTALGGALSANAVILMFCGVFWTIFELATLSANAVFGGLINDVVPRPFLGRFYGLFRAFSLIAGIIFNYWLFAKATNHYVWVFVGVSILYGVGFMLMCLKVKEGEYPAPPPAPPMRSGGPFERFISGTRLFFKECFSNSYYRWIFLGWTFSNLAFIPVNSFSIPYYASVKMSAQSYGNFIALTYVISLVLSYSLGVVCDRFHPLRVSIAAMGLYAVCAAWGGLFATNAHTFAIGLVAHGVLSGTFFTTSASLGQRLYPHARFAQFASAATMILAISQVLLGPTLGRMLDLTGHNYRYTFTFGMVLSLLGMSCLLVVQRKFMALGGPKHYVAPACGEHE